MKKYDKLEVSLSDVCGGYIHLEKMDIEQGKIFRFSIKVDKETLQEISKEFDLEIDIIPF